MGRPSLPLGSYGKIKTWQEGSTYVARVQFRDFDGVIRQVKRTGKSKAAAERALKGALAERRAPVKDAEITPHTKFAKVADLWFVELVAKVDDGTRSPGTLDTYRSVYKTSVKPALAELRVWEVTTPVVDRTLGKVKESSVSRARTAKIIVSGVMRLAARHGAVTINPTREVDRIESRPKRKPRSLSGDERLQWIELLEASPKACTWDLPDLTRGMLATGSRIGEALALGWTELDLEEGTADIAWHLVRRTGVGLLRLPSTKSGLKGERLVPLPGWSVDMFRRRREHIPPGVEPVYPDSLGGWRDPSNVRRIWREVRDAAELEGLVSHHLRKTVATMLDDADVSTRKISDQLGHSRVSMTQDNYLGRGLTDRQTADVLEDMFKPGDGKTSV